MNHLLRRRILFSKEVLSVCLFPSFLSHVQLASTFNSAQIFQIAQIFHVHMQLAQTVKFLFKKP